MHAEASGGAVRLCNISPIGALIEGEALPMVGDEVELRRGPLAVAGRIVWRGSDQAGVSFDERTIVEDWLPNAHPQRVVDRVFQRILQEQRRAEDDGATIAPLHASYITVDDMTRATAALEKLADALSEEDTVVIRHATRLQSLDIAAQLLRKLARRDD